MYNHWYDKLMYRLGPVLKHLVVPVRGFVTFLFKYHIVQSWYKLYRWMFEFKYYSPNSPLYSPVPAYSSLYQLADLLGNKLKWRADSLKQLFDAMGTAEAVQYKMSVINQPFIGDCDEFAVYAATAINKSILADPDFGVYYFNKRIKKAYVMTVMWLRYSGQTWRSNYLGFGGHNVCVIELEDGDLAWMDYGMPSMLASKMNPILSIDYHDNYNLIERDVHLVYAHGDTDSLGWVVSDPETLELVKMKYT